MRGRRRRPRPRAAPRAEAGSSRRRHIHASRARDLAGPVPAAQGVRPEASRGGHRGRALLPIAAVPRHAHGEAGRLHPSRVRRKRFFGSERRSRRGDAGPGGGCRRPRVPRGARARRLDRTIRDALPTAHDRAALRQRHARPRGARIQGGARRARVAPSERRRTIRGPRAVGAVSTRNPPGAAAGRRGVRVGHRGVPRDAHRREADEGRRRRMGSSGSRGHRRRRRR